MEQQVAFKQHQPSAPAINGLKEATLFGHFSRLWSFVSGNVLLQNNELQTSTCGGTLAKDSLGLLSCFTLT